MMTARLSLAAILCWSLYHSICWAADPSATVCFPSAVQSDASERIYQVLEGPITSDGIESVDEPLEHLLRRISEQYQINARLDLQSLEDLGISPDQPVTGEYSNMAVSSALKHLLKDLDLTYVVENEVLLVTTTEEADAKLTICVYPIADLVNSSSKVKSERKDGSLTELIDVLISTVATDTWAENGGGEAEIRPLSPDLLVISQTQAVHEEIRNTLAAIRRARQFSQKHTKGDLEQAESTGKSDIPERRNDSDDLFGPPGDVKEQRVQ